MILFNKNRNIDSIPKRRLGNFSQIDKKRFYQKSDDSFISGRTIAQNYSFRHSKNTNLDNRIDPSPRMTIHHLSIKRKKISIIFLFSMAISVFIWLMLTNFTASVDISIVDNKIISSVDETKYKKVINEFYNSNPFARFSFVLAESQLERYVVSKMNEVQTVSVNKNSTILGKTDFIISFRQPVASWEIGSSQYYVDSKGVSFFDNYYPKPIVQIVDNTGIVNQEGSAIASSRFLSFVGKVVALSNEKGMPVSKVILPRNTTRELDLYLIDRGELFIKLSVDRLVGEQIEDMVNAIKYFDSKDKKPQYIDVRVSGKAFYK